MSEQDRTITRRSALATGTLFLGAGLMAAAGTRPAPVAAEAVQTVAVTVVNFPDVLADLEESHEAWRAASRKMNEGFQRLRDQLDPASYSLVMSFIEGDFWLQVDTWNDLLIAEMVRHAPMLAPVIENLWAHVMEEHPNQIGQCCMPE